MKTSRAVWIIAALLVALPASAAQKFIAISDSLVAHADRLDVKEGGQWFGKITKWRIGDYAVVSSKLSATRVKAKSNLFKTHSERHSVTKFSFVMCAPSTDSVAVHAERHAMDDSTHEFKVTKSVGLGDNDLMQSSDSSTATIAVNGDTTGAWTFSKIVTGAPTPGFQFDLARGDRRIVFKPVRSKMQGEDGRRVSFFARLAGQAIPPAMGYEFLEGDESVCAVQTYGGGAKEGSRVVWLRRSLDARLKLVLVAAITTILEVESSSTGLEEPAQE